EKNWFLVEIFEEFLYKMCEKLPQTVRMEKNQFQFDQQIKLMIGSLRQLARKKNLEKNGIGMNVIDRFCLSQVHLRKFLLAIGQILEFDYNRIGIGPEYSSATRIGTVSEWKNSVFAEGKKAVRPEWPFKY